MLCGKLQLYFEKITELVVTGADSQLVRDAFVSLATDSGLHPLVPYFTQFVADEV
jgi:transcription initiation factor TFIID subunit 6